MNRQFPLAGLLRLRQLQQDQAATGMARAASRSEDAHGRRAAARKELGDSVDSAVSSSSLLALAAARASSQSMLADLDALSAAAEADLAEARADYTQARRMAVGLEKLELRHDAELAAAELHAEQGVLDEIAATSWHRKAGEATS
ncbi:flagellar export protein FliJ [Pseudarthrobacter sp. AG30]|uniref:flagellar FliJ family protein n=1 Tax=unclassified Pseudarthrobacter TaxID=2647000 RepID=UPI000D6522F2|nr:MULTISPECIES: flagellar FliJ family protein [unclassified Pseudarthrobacter]RAX16981.1 flagellar export protein FliJ [Pseudarthrobacter sp. AG30]